MSTEPPDPSPDVRFLQETGVWERVWLFLIAATCLLILAGAPLPHLDGDDFFYGDIAWQILASGDWITLRHPDQPQWIVDKPPVSFWLMALSIRLGGDNVIALRLWHLIMALVAILVTYRIARMGDRMEEGLLAALLLGTSVEGGRRRPLALEADCRWDRGLPADGSPVVLARSNPTGTAVH